MFKLILIWTICLIVAHGQQCPARCSCAGRSVRCSGRNLTTTPLIFSSKVLLLDLRNNQIRAIKSSSFEGIANVKVLSLSHNHLEQLDDQVFYYTKSVERLYLDHNKLTELTDGLLSELSRLKVIRLDGNSIAYIQNGAFDNNLNLEKIVLSRNQLTTIDPNIGLRNLRKLAELKLDSNPIHCACALHSLLFIVRTSKMAITGQCLQPEVLRTKKIAELTVTDLKCTPPIVVKGPEQVAAQDVGTVVKLSCKMGGEPKPDTVWIKDGSMVNDRLDEFTVEKNGAVLRVTILPSSVGAYRCVGINMMGTTSSVASNLAVRTRKTAPEPRKPESKVKSGLKTILGSKVLLSCQSKSRTADWFRGSTRIIMDGTKYQLLPNGSLVIKHVSDQDGGLYKCSGEEMSTEVTILGPPIFRDTPDDLVIVDHGTYLMLTCRADGYPGPEITWYKMAMGKKLTIGKGTQLNIKMAKAEDEGEYECRAANEVGLAVKVFMVKVNGGHFDENLVSDSVLFKRRTGGQVMVNHNSMTEADLKSAAAEAMTAVNDAIDKTQTSFKGTKVARGRLLKFGTSRFIDTQSRDAAMSMEVFQRSIEILNRKSKMAADRGRHLNASSIKDLNYESKLNTNQLNLLATLSGCEAGLRTLNVRQSLDRVALKDGACDTCRNSKWRTYDGTCNNMANKTWGSSLTIFRRLLPADYTDGLYVPKGWSAAGKQDGRPLPSPRKVSLELSARQVDHDPETSHMFMQWGQFIDHDIGLTLVGLSVNQFAGEALDCSKTCDHIEPCFSIPLEKNDPRAQRRHLGGRSNNTNGCIELIRSAAFCGTGLTSAATGQVVKREQVNRITSFIDASMVYGSDEVMARELRMKGRDTGLLATHFQDGRHYMPLDDLRRPFLDCQQSPGDSETPCFLAGDTRANEQLGLTAMHTLFVREHNRIAKQLTLMNRRWSGEKVYQTARLIVGAMIQKITYSDWLPMVIGPQLMAKLVGQYGGYDDRVDPSATNVFQTAAFRFGHTLIRPFLTRLNSSNLPLERYKAELPLVEAFFAPFRLLAEGGVDPIIRGLVATGMKQVRPDMVINAQLTEHLFELSRDVSLDLAAINIQRGRDHGLPGYNDWRHFCGLPVAQTFDDLRNEIRDKKVRSKLSALYGHPGNIDLWVAGVTENTVPGGQVGPTFACLIAEQFKRTRTGDRFWYENLFTVDQIKEIQKSSLAAILCSSSDGIVNVPRNVFKLAHPDKWSSCASVDQLDLSKWSATSETDNCIET